MSCFAVQLGATLKLVHDAYQFEYCRGVQQVESPADKWRESLMGWGIPGEILEQAPQSSLNTVHVAN